MMIQGWLARPGAGPGSRTVIPGPVRLTGLPGSLQAGACRGPNLRANSGCRGTTRILSVYVRVWRESCSFPVDVGLSEEVHDDEANPVQATLA